MAISKDIKQPEQADNESHPLTEEELDAVTGGKKDAGEASGWVNCERCGHPYLPPTPCPQCYREDKIEQDTMS